MQTPKRELKPYFKGGCYLMSNLKTAIFLIKNGFVETRYFNNKFQVKITPKGKEA